MLESPLLPPPIFKFKCHAERQRGISKVDTESNDKKPIINKCIQRLAFKGGETFLYSISYIPKA